MATFQKVKLGDIAKIIDCPHSTPKWVDCGVFAVRNFNLSNGKIVKEKSSYVDEKTFEVRTKRAIPKKGDCILSREAPIGSVGYINTDEKMCLGQRVVLIQPKDSIDSRYLLYQLLSSEIQNQFRQSDGSGSTVSNLRMPLIRNTKISVTDIDAQKTISSIIGAYDDLIENNEKRIKILEEMTQRLYVEWFVRFKFPGHEKVKMVDSGTQYGMIPEGWGVRPLKDVCSKITDGSHFSPTSVKQGKPMASVKDMLNWGINVKSCRVISEEDYEILVKSDCKPRKNDILIAKDGSYLKHSFVVEEELDLVILSSIAILRPNGVILPNQLSFFLKLPHVKEQMKGCVSGVAIPRIVLKDFRKFKVVAPPLTLQKSWAKVCDKYLTLCRRLVKEDEQLSQFRNLLIPQLFTGMRSLKSND